MNKSPKIIWGMMAFGIYFLLLGLLFFYFNSKNEDKPKKFVKKNEKRIQVGLTNSKEKEVSKVKPKKNIVQKKKPKIISKPNTTKPKDTPKVIKEKLVNKIIKKKDLKTKKVKKKSTKKENLKKPKKTLDLFSDIKTDENKLDMNITDKPIKTTPEKSLIKVTEKTLSASERVSSSLKIQKEFKSGEENAYFAKVQSMLEDWPAQSDFAGEKATVILSIKPNGKFEFRIKSGSNINEFNEGLIAFLEQLQSIGFGPHNGEKTYEYEAEFIAKE
jgi:protein TonB